MQLNRFWSSVWMVALFLAGVGLVQYIVSTLLTLFGLLPSTLEPIVTTLAMAVVPVVGTFLYTDWRWGWKRQHMGLRTGPAASVGLLALGLVIGAVGSLLAQIVSALLNGQGLVLAPPDLGAVSPMALVIVLLPLFASELVFRGAVVSRYQSDLTPREVLIAATLTPFAFAVIERFFGLMKLPNVVAAWQAPLIIFLALLFLRTDSVWLSGGIRMGAAAAALLLAPAVTSEGLVVVWGAAALVLLILEWLKQQRMPRRVQPRGNARGRVFRGPWQGPH